MSWHDQGWVAFDVETSGFGPTARILEIAAVTFEGGLPVHSFSSLVCPKDLDWEKAAGALEVNKLTKEILHDAPTFEEIMPDLLLELSNPVWVAHNIAFDLEQTQQEIARLGGRLEAPALCLCTCRLAALISPMEKGNKLYQVAARYGVPQESAHRAEVDAIVCGNLLDRMRHQGKLPEDTMAMQSMMAEANQKWRRR